MTGAGPLLEHIPTADGARLAVKRRPAAGGTPVILVHGLAVNADLWNLPDVRGSGFHYRSLASILHEAGYDIWLVNLRGHGGPHMLSTPPPGQADWCVDHFILFDLPAVVDHVVRHCPRRPFLVGASMGSMTTAGFLQGARLDETAGRPRIVADPALATRRQASLAGCVLAEFPAALRWPDALYDASGRLRWRELLRDWWRTSGDANYPFELLARWSWLQAVVTAAGAVPLDWLRREAAGEPWYRALPESLGRRVERLECVAVQGLLNLAGMFTGATNHRAEVLLRGRRFIMDHMKAGVLQQMAKCVRQGALVSLLGTPDHVYSDHYELVVLPTLVVQGGRDRIASASVTRSAFFDRIRSVDKEFLLDEQIAHGEIEAAPVACTRLYPRIKAWLDARR